MAKTDLKTDTPEYLGKALKILLVQELSLEAAQRLSVNTGMPGNWGKAARHGSTPPASPLGNRSVAERMEKEVLKTAPCGCCVPYK